MRKDVGEQLGNYRVLRLLGEGGQASVYLGEHVYLKSQAALKVRHTVLTQEEQAIFLQEAQTLVQLNHPHIVRVLDFALQDGLPFLVMEYAAHGSLRQRHPRGTHLPLEVIVLYVKQVASALQNTHDQGLIHRDVKPENILLNSHDQVLLSDFGLVMIAPHLLSSEATEPMEQSLAGTTSYLAPEQVRGKAQSASDQYALAVVVYEWLCGKPPFQGPFLEVAVKLVSEPIPSLREQVPELPPAVEEVVLRALAKEPELRFARVQDFATALEHASQGAFSPRFTPVLALDHRSEAEQRRSSMHDLPRGTVTLLFTDMEGSTQLLQQLGDRYASVLTECRQMLRAAFQHWSGHEVDTQGDAFFVAFARATDAVSAAVAMQRALAAHAWPNGVTVRVRMGVHTGEPQHSSEGYVGLDVHHTARIMSAGHGGQVLLSQTTRDLVEQTLPEGVSLLDLGKHRLKDLQRPSHLFQLVISGLAADFPVLKTLDTQPNNLPVQPTAFIGREQELAAVAALLCREDVHLVTLTGPGGTGKTRLGLQVAAELSEVFPDGVFFVNLAPLSDPEFVLPAIAQVLNIKEIGGQSLPDLLKAFLREKHMLLLLDNFEQVVNAALPVAELLTACPKLKIMVTSRAVLHVRAEHEFAVPPLELPDPKRLPDLVALSQYEAVALFIQQAQAVKSDFQMTNANAPTIAEICARLDGLPLAIELAAARIKLLPPQALLTRLSQRLDVLTSGTQDLPVRQQTLRNTLQWSYDLLTQEEQRLFRWLSVFVGGFTLEAATAVCNAGSNPPLDVLNGVASLLDKSLLLQTEQEGEEPRLRMLETLREFGLARLSTNGERAAAERAHAWYYLALAEEAEPHLVSHELVQWLDRLERERENLRAVLQRATTGEDEEVQLALRLSNALLYLWIHRWYPSEGRSFLERGLARSQAILAPLRLKALIADGLLMWIQNDARSLAPVAEEALALARVLEDQGSLVYAFALQGIAIMDTRDYAAARSCFEEALALARAQGDRFLTAFVLMSLGRLAMYQREHQRAIVLFEESLPLYRAIGNPLFIAVVLSILSHAMLRQGELAQASVLLEEMLAIGRKVRAKWGIAVAFSQLGQIAFQQGEMERAEALFAESLQLSQEQGDRRSMVRTRLLMAGLAARQGNYTLARAQYEESLTVAIEMGLAGFIASGLKGLGCVAAAQGQYTWSVLLWGAAENRPESYSVAIPRTIYERMRATTRAHLGESAFVQNLAEGRSMTPEQALAVQKTLPTQTAHEAKSPPVVSPFPTKRAPAYPAGLTAREVEVLRLVAEGLTDAQVAEQLVISLRTVNAHLTSIYQKIHVSSRGAATRYALEHQLV